MVTEATIKAATLQHQTEALRLESMMAAAAGENATIEADHGGQVVVYSGLKEEGRNNHGMPVALVPITDEDYE